MNLGVNDRPSTGLGSWRVRRRFLFLVTGFCMACITYVLAQDMRGGVAEAVVVAAFTTIAAALGSYVFAASWQDVRIDQHRTSPDPFYPAAYRRPARGRVDDPEDL